MNKSTLREAQMTGLVVVVVVAREGCVSMVPSGPVCAFLCERFLLLIDTCRQVYSKQNNDNFISFKLSLIS